MQAAIDQFRVNIKRVRDFLALHSALSAQVTTAIDLSDILRAALVMAVSALDYFVHELVRLGMLEIWRKKRAETQAFQRFSISLSSARSAVAGASSDDWFDYEIRTRQGWQSFQHPDRIADAIRLVSDLVLWEEVARKMGRTAEDVKQQLELVVDRRNKIAHEADLDPTFPNTRWPIDETLVSDAATFIEQVAETIFQVV
jgi:hypothetical protein